MGNDLVLKEYEKRAVCIFCGSGDIVIYWEPRYNGFRGTCHNCNTNWAES